MTSSDYILVHFVCGSYPQDKGGVARFDNLLKRIFPQRIFFKAPEEAKKMEDYLVENAGQKIIVVTDNQHSLFVPELFPLIIVHHGVARIHAERDPNWETSIKDYCVNGQDMIFEKRNPHNTIFVSISSFCRDYFEKIYQKDYTRFLGYNLLYPIESSPPNFSQNRSLWKNVSCPVILGDWRTINKGLLIVRKLVQLLPEFQFLQLRTRYTNDMDEHQIEIESFYQKSQIYLSLSKSEGCGFAVVDAFNHNQLVIGTNVGILYQLDKDNNRDKNNQKYAEVFPWEWVDQSRVENIANLIKLTWSKRDQYGSGKDLEKEFSYQDYANKWRNICLNLFLTSLSSPLIYPTDEIIHWQYPVITEKYFGYKMILKHNLKKKTDHMGNYLYLSIPWATIIDKNHVNQKWLRVIKQMVEFRKRFLEDCQVVSLCQHIYFEKIKDIYHQLGIDILLITHKKNNQNYLESKHHKIELRGIPLYPIMALNQNSGLAFSLEQVSSYTKKYLFSFQGAYMDHYLHPIRKYIFQWWSDNDYYIKNIGDWHFEKEVYDHQIRGINYSDYDQEKDNQRALEYRKLVLESVFTLCPVGAGVNTIRFWEVLGLGSIPVIISDDFNPIDYLPEEEHQTDFYLKISMNDSMWKEDKPKTLRNILKGIDDQRRKKMIENGYRILKTIMKKYPIP